MMTGSNHESNDPARPEQADPMKMETRIDAPHFLATESNVSQSGSAETGSGAAHKNLFFDAGGGTVIDSPPTSGPSSTSGPGEMPSCDSHSFAQQDDSSLGRSQPHSTSYETPQSSWQSSDPQQPGSASPANMSGMPETSQSNYGTSVSPDMLRIQADQLAEFLRDQQDELDRRESQLNARSAQFEQLVRRTKMSMLRQQSEADQRESMIAEAERELKRRNTEISVQEKELGQRQQTLQQQFSQRDQTLMSRERELDDRQHQLEKAATDIARRERQVESQTVELREAAEEYKKVKQIEKMLVEAQAEVTRMRQGIIRQRQQMQKEIAQYKSRLDGEYRRRIEEVEKERNAIARKSKHLDHSRMALDRARDETGKMHRDTLEIRLATEELWLELSELAPPEALTRSLGQIRAKLADQYREAIARVSRQKEDLEGVRGQLMEQHDKLLNQRKEVEGWSHQREHELTEKESVLQHREDELERRESAFDTLARQWISTNPQTSLTGQKLQQFEQSGGSDAAGHAGQIDISDNLIMQENATGSTGSTGSTESMAIHPTHQPSAIDATLRQEIRPTRAPASASASGPIAKESQDKKTPAPVRDEWSNLGTDKESEAGGSLNISNIDPNA